jgi:Protein of unknown function (DUF1203)
MSFRLSGLPAAPFRSLFLLREDELQQQGMERRVTEIGCDYPCRVSLEVASPGETVILLPYDHQPAHSPYRSTGPIFVREAASETFDFKNRIPNQMRPRLMSVRAYDERDYIVTADVSPGIELENLIERLFERRDVAYLHVHHARWGCYVCRIDRA